VLNVISSSSLPENRVADILSSLIIRNDNTGKFTFDNDGWGDSGEGTVSFAKDKITVAITIKNSSDDNWSIFEGKKLFTRNKP
jgi:hypothetical protein